MKDQNQQLARLSQFAEWAVQPQMERWQGIGTLSGHTYQELHLGHTLLELIAWVWWGTGTDLFPQKEGLAIIQRLFSSLGAEYQYLVEHWSSEWGPDMREALDLAYAAQGKSNIVDVQRASTDVIAAYYDTSLGLMADFMDDAAAQFYLSAQAFFDRAAWDSEQVDRVIVDWSRGAMEANEPPPVWFAGYLGAVGHFYSLNLLFANETDSAVNPLKRRIYDSHMWRLNLREEETRRRFDDVTKAVLSIIDLINSAKLSSPDSKSELEFRIATVRSDLLSLDEEIAGGAGAG